MLILVVLNYLTKKPVSDFFVKYIDFHLYVYLSLNYKPMIFPSTQNKNIILHQKEIKIYFV